MAGSSPAHRSTHWSIPDRTRPSDYLSEDRNNELNHQEALAAAHAEHERVRLAAIRVIQHHEHQLTQQRLQEEQQQVLAKQKREVERLEQEKKLREEQERLRDLEARSVPKLPPKPPSEALAKPEINSSSSPSNQNAAPTAAGPVQQAAVAKSNPFISSTATPSVTPRAGQTNGDGTSVPKLSTATLLPQQASSAAPAASNTPSSFAKSTAPVQDVLIKPAATATINGFPAAGTAEPVAATSLMQPQASQTVDHFARIHQNLKKLRVAMVEQAKTNPQLKKRMGDMRRELRKSVGQLTSEKGANRQQLDRIKNLLLESLSGQTPSALIDPSDYTCGNREPIQGAVHNGPQLPSLFIYLINQFAKAIVNQFASECGSTPKNADAVGVIAAQMFSAKDFQWRGKSMIDILMAKYRMSCPVLFGYNGNEKTQQGRTRLGWKKQDGQWISEQQHVDAMKGLGVGYASIALRDFSRSPNINPWPPSKYWSSMANILNTKPAEISDTQCVVLRAMILLYEEKFVAFYGSAAIAALRKALIEFPAKVQNKTPNVAALQVLAQVYLRDMGLDLR